MYPRVSNKLVLVTLVFVDLLQHESNYHLEDGAGCTIMGKLND